MELLLTTHWEACLEICKVMASHVLNLIPEGETFVIYKHTIGYSYFDPYNIDCWLIHHLTSTLAKHL